MFKKILSIFIKNSNDVSNPKVRESYGKFAGIVGIILNIFLCSSKILVGIITSAVSVIADGINNLTDASSNIISMLGFKMAGKPADKEHPYGHGRYEYISSLIIAFIIVVIGEELLRNGIDKIINPNELLFSTALFVILIASILVKLFMMFFNLKISKIINSTTLKATSVDSRNDAIATLGVLVALIISKFSSINLDGYMAVAVSIFIMISGILLIKDTLNEILGKAPSKEQVAKIKSKIMSYDGVIGVHDLIIHDYGVGRQFASVHIEMPKELDVLISHDTIDKIEKDFLEQDNLHIIIHYDPVATKDEFYKELKAYIQENIKVIDKNLSIHDLRIVNGVDRKIAVFDCVVPIGIKFTNVEIKELITKLINKQYPNVETNITIDTNYVE